MTSFDMDILSQEDVATKAAPDMTTSQLIEAMWKLKNMTTELNAKKKDINNANNIYKSAFITLMDEQGSDLARAHGVSAQITEMEVPNMGDFDAFARYVVANDAWHLVKKSVNSAPWRELLQQEGVIVPGTSVYVKRDISLRKSQR